MNDTWGYKVDDHHYKSVEDLLRQLIDIVSKGGNLLLNMGPTGEGELDSFHDTTISAYGAIFGGAEPDPVTLVHSQISQLPHCPPVHSEHIA